MSYGMRTVLDTDSLFDLAVFVEKMKAKEANQRRRYEETSRKLSALEYSGIDQADYYNYASEYERLSRYMKYEFDDLLEAEDWTYYYQRWLNQLPYKHRKASWLTRLKWWWLSR